MINIRFQHAATNGKARYLLIWKNDPSTVNKIEFTLDEAGQYWLGGNNGGDFLYVEVQSLYQNIQSKEQQ